MSRQPAQRQRSSRRRLTRLELALLVSLLLHGALALVLVFRLRVEAPPRPPEAQPIEIVIREVVPEPPHELPTEPPPIVAPPKPLPPPQAKARPAAREDDDSEPIEYDDEPKPELQPHDSVVGLPKGMEAEGSRGHTTHNAPGEVPDAATLRAQREAQGKGRVQGFAEDGLASRRVTNGLVSPYFHALRRELTAGLVHPPEIFDKNQTSSERLRDWATQLKESTRGGWERYGATGAPYAEPAGYDPKLEVPSKLGEAALNGEPGAIAAVSKLHQQARLLEWANGAAGVELIDIVEVRQDSDGALRSLVLQKATGVRAFDAWVLEMARLSVQSLKETPPDAGVGIHASGLRSVWEFKGKVSYMRASTEFDAKQDAWYLLAMMPLGFAPGTFDEVSGSMSYVDLRYPHYEATVKLLQVY